MTEADIDIEDRMDLCELAQQYYEAIMAVGGPDNWRYIRAIAVGSYRARYPHTATTIARHLGVPRQTAVDTLYRLEAEGWVMTEIDGSRHYWHCTEKTRDAYIPVCNKGIIRVLEFADRVRARHAVDQPPDQQVRPSR